MTLRAPLHFFALLASSHLHSIPGPFKNILSSKCEAISLHSRIALYAHSVAFALGFSMKYIVNFDLKTRTFATFKLKSCISFSFHHKCNRMIAIHTQACWQAFFFRFAGLRTGTVYWKAALPLMLRRYDAAQQCKLQHQPAASVGRVMHGIIEGWRAAQVVSCDVDRQDIPVTICFERSAIMEPQWFRILCLCRELLSTVFQNFPRLGFCTHNTSLFQPHQQSEVS